MDYGFFYPDSGFRPPAVRKADKSRIFAENEPCHGTENSSSGVRRRVQCDAGRRNAAPAGERRRFVRGASDAAFPADLRFLCGLSQGDQVRRHDLRPALLRLSGGNARLSGARAGDRVRGRRTGVPAEGLGAGFPSGPHPRHVAGPQHEGIRLLFVRGERGAAPLGARARDGRGLFREDPSRAGACHRPPQQTAHRHQYRDAAGLLPAFLRAAVHHAVEREPRRADPFRGAAGRLFLRWPGPARRASVGEVLRRGALPVAQLFRRPGEEGDGPHGAGVYPAQAAGGGQGADPGPFAHDRRGGLRTGIPVPAALYAHVQEADRVN